MTTLVIHCPECPNIQQGTSVPRDKLRQMLESSEEITVMGSICGHVWKLSQEELKKLRMRLWRVLSRVR